MDFGSLKAFCTIVETGSISKAARKLFISQPALSVKLQGLEKYYQEKLLERTNKGIRTTETGQLVYDQGLKILTLLDNIERDIDRHKRPVHELIVGASSTIGNYALPCTVYVFSERHPKFKITLNISNTEEVIDKMLNRTIEMGLVEGTLSESLRQTLAQENIKTKIITNNELFLITPNKEGVNAKYLNDNKAVPLEAFKKMPLILREKGSGTRASIETALAEKNLALTDLNVVLELNTVNSIKSAVAANNGVSLLPKMALRKELHYKILNASRVEGLTFKHDVVLLYTPGKTDKPPYSTFLKFVSSKDRAFC